MLNAFEPLVKNFLEPDQQGLITEYLEDER